ncbi:hypothetical protein CRUP_015361 [Coryphaenoides rupestris]|nr:hypothetical protein CRUP_015361 [Coryphaenoides rupestris]
MKLSSICAKWCTRSVWSYTAQLRARQCIAHVTEPSRSTRP